MHQMTLTSSTSTADVFECPICGRRLIIQRPPDYKKVVLVEGDPNEQHSGGRGGIRIVAEIEPTLPGLDVFENWANKYLQEDEDG